MTDALLLAHEADSTILVVQQNQVDRLVLKRAIASLRKVTPRLAGAVLNAVDVKSKAYYGYTYKDKQEKDQEETTRRRTPGARRGRRTTAGPEVSDVSLS